MFRSTRLHPAALGFATVTVLAGCAAEKPYVLSDYMSNQQGVVQVCHHHDSPPKDIAALAEEVCNHYHRTAKLWLMQKGQCNLSSPDISTFYCVARPGETPPPFVNKHAPLRSHSSGSDMF